MKRPPWIAIVLGASAWAGVIALAVNDIWWPLWVGGGITIVALVTGAVMTLIARRMTRSAQTAVRENPAPRTEPVAEPPVRTGRAGPRTNAKTAGRRNKGAVTAVALGLWVAQANGCGRLAEENSEPAKEAKAGEAKAGETKSADSKTSAPVVGVGDDPALAAALAHAIRPPPTGEATYRVDPFVAVLVFERVKAGADPKLTRLEKPVEGGPQAGFVVGEVADGSLAHRLGLRTGDVVEAINGVVLTAPDRVGFALDGAGRLVELTIHRDDVSIVMRYEMDESLAWTELLAGFTGDADPRVAAADAGALDGAAGDEAAAEAGRGDGAGPVEPTPSDDDGGGGTPTPTPTPSGGGGKLPSGGGGGSGAGGGGGGGTTPKPTPTPTPSGPGPVSCESSSKCTISKALFDSMVSNPSKLESQANIVPAIANDVHSGYKLKTVKPGTSIAKLGFQSNDKITHINGYDLTDDFQAAQLYMGVSSTKIFKIRYERGGARLVKTVVVK